MRIRTMSTFCTLIILAATQAMGAENKLPGARPAIQAIQYPTLQAALDAIPPEGGKVILPAGTFEINRPLLLTRGDVWIEGAGTATHIKNVNENGEPAFRIAPAGFTENPKSRIWRVGLARLRITGNPKSGPGIEALGVNEILIESISVSYNGSDGIRLTDCYEDPRVIGALLTYNAHVGLNILRCHDIVVSACQFEENQDALHCIDSFNLCMTGNNLDDHLRDGVVIENTYGSVLSGNMIEECQGRAVVLDRDCYGITLSANVIAHNFGGGIDLRDAHGCAVSANTFTINPAGALRIGPDSSRITVTGNNFSDSYIGDGKVKRKEGDRAAGGLILQGAANVCISGNVFSGTQPKALDTGTTAARRVVFNGNIFIGTQGDQARLEDSVITGNIEDIR